MNDMRVLLFQVIPFTRQWSPCDRYGALLALFLALLGSTRFCSGANPNERATFPQPGEWPAMRGSSTLDGHAVGRGKIAHPKVAWKHFVGRLRSVIVVEPGTRASTFTLPQIAAANSIDETQLRDRWQAKPTVARIAGREQVFEPTNEETFAEILSEHPGLERIEFVSGFALPTRNGQWQNGSASLSAWKDGKWQKIWETDPIEYSFMPSPLVGDFDADGELEIAALPWRSLQIYTARTGAIEEECAFTKGRSYGFFGVYDFDGDGKSEFLVMADVPKHITVLGYRDGKLGVLWRHEIELGVENPVKMLRFIPEPVGDFDGDHVEDVVANTFNDTSDGKWHLVVRDGISGKVKLDLADEIAQGVDDVDEDGVPELLTTSTSGRHVPDYGTIRARSAKGTSLVAIWQCDNAGWQCQQTPRPLHQQCYNRFSRHGALVRHIQGSAQVVVRKKSPNAVDEAVLSIVRWQGGGFNDVATVRGRELQAIGIDRRGATLVECLLAPKEEQRLSVVGGAVTCLASGMPVLRPRVPPSLTFHKPKPTRLLHIPPLPALETPIVLRDGPMREPHIATQGSGGEVVVFRPPLRERGGFEVWRQRGYGAIGAALQGDERRQLIFATASPKSHAVLTAVNVADGAPYWRCEFPNFSGGSPAWNLGGPLYWHVGHFTAERPQDLLVTLRREIHHSEETFLLSGKDGSEIWHRSRQISDRGCGGQRFAIADFNGDGLDDAANCFPSIHYILDGPTGRNQIAEDNEWPEVPIKSVYWVQPIAGDFDQSGKASLLLASTGSHMIGRLQVDGKLAWSTAYDEAGNCYPAIGDFDGDGRRDAVFTGFSDGIRCYDTANGKVNWTLLTAQDRYVESVVSADLDSDGCDEAVFSLDNSLYCVGTTSDGKAGEVRWKLDFPARISSPAIVGIGEADEKSEANHQSVSQLSILVAAEDGYVYSIQ